MKRYLASIGIAALVPLLFWCGGFDFDQRGGPLFLCVVYTIGAFGFAFFFYPRWTDGSME